MDTVAGGACMNNLNVDTVPVQDYPTLTIRQLSHELIKFTPSVLLYDIQAFLLER